MPFSLTRPSSPTHREPTHTHHPASDEELASALHAALQSGNLNASTATLHPNHTSPYPPHDSSPAEAGAHKDKDRPRLEVVLDNDPLFLKGTGVDVEPTRMSGHVALYLAESTSIKEITLQFRGKARLPASQHDSISLNNGSGTYIVCTHDWSFLEGEKKHSHTLKAGRHFFPFQLQVGGSLPSSIYTSMFGSASVAYKFRAHAVRPGLSHNLQAITPVTLLRSFASEALEYQQTLEIENTWPGKLMYSIMIPHKAYAIGDSIVAVVKFSPLTKGTKVLNISTSLCETVKIASRGAHSNHSQENTRVVHHVKHEIVQGKAVLVEEKFKHWSSRPATPAASSVSGVASGSRSSHSQNQSGGGYFSFMNSHLSEPVTPAAVPGTTTPPFASSSSSAAVAGPSSQSGSQQQASSSSSSQANEVIHNPLDEEPSADVVTQIELPVPVNATPTHSLDPIHVSHRVRWSILIGNLDGHTSELRCSLPIHILDARLLDEARANTAAARRLLLEGPDAGEVQEEEGEGRELPSYNAHVRDRIANQYLNEASTVRVANPWVNSGFSPTVGTTPGVMTSGTNSPMDRPEGYSHLPMMPESGPSTPLDWVNNELLMSLSQSQQRQTNSNGDGHRVTTPGSRQTPPSSSSNSNPASHGSSRAHSRAPSRTHSRRGSRRPSPERQNSHASPHVSGPNEMYVHEGTQANRGVQGVFSASMKPFTSISTPHWFSRSSSHQNLSSIIPAASDHHHNHNHHHHHHHQHHQQQNQHPQYPPSSERQRSMPLASLPSSPSTPGLSLNRAFTEVPDYDVAARGFIGGIPPLSSMQGLPSYDEAETIQARRGAPHIGVNAHADSSTHQDRTHSDPQLAGRFEEAMQGNSSSLPMTPAAR